MQVNGPEAFHRLEDRDAALGGRLPMSPARFPAWNGNWTCTTQPSGPMCCQRSTLWRGQTNVCEQFPVDELIFGSVFPTRARAARRRARTCHPCRCRKGRWSRFSDGCGSVAHPPKLGGSVAWLALVRRDEEIETAAGHVGNLGGAPRALVEFRSGGAAVDVGSDLLEVGARVIVLAGHLLKFPSIRNSESRRERLFSRYQQKYQQIGRLGSDENKRAEHRCSRKGLFFKGFRALGGRLRTLWNELEQPSWCTWPESNRREKGPFPVLSWGVACKWPRHEVLRGGRLNGPRLVAGLAPTPAKRVGLPKIPMPQRALFS